jgi:hypothetical protein
MHEHDLPREGHGLLLEHIEHLVEPAPDSIRR